MMRRTPFFEHHKASGAKLIDFGGWEMPVQYTSILEEHRRVRESVGLFDVSHMGEVRFRGKQAIDAARFLVTNDVDVPLGHAQYTAMCQEDGGIVDDLIVYRLADDDVLICVNASNRDKDFQFMVGHNPLPNAVKLENQSDQWAQIAVQGRNAIPTLEKLTSLPIRDVPSFGLLKGELAGVQGCILARTGYTGEDGYEVFIPAAQATRVWPLVLEAGKDFGILPIGLGARDTLRLEAKLCLYGNDIDETTNPFEAGLQWVVAMDKPDFVGKQALVAVREKGGPDRRLVCLTVKDRIPRPHCKILQMNRVVGEVTSGTRSPTLDANIALGYVRKDLAKVGTRVEIDVRGKPAEAEVTKPPFYKRPY
jgi:aminomethyltransferase